ncbi:hypothetical protein ACFQVD_22595 [Streptosporangium amethystogenes subsp. fukuiense]|uniref:Uncharacterized protein n=1 Tax=Streptosporangium amethystogenes subsp. fukuiense TaxID=698418 RepID=A0ABW2T4G3_9ACTN
MIGTPLLAGLVMATAITAPAPVTAHADVQRPAAAADWPESGSFLRYDYDPATDKFEASTKGTYEITGIHPDLFQPVGTAHVKGNVTNHTTGDFRCAFGLFRITYRTADGSLLPTMKYYRNCKGKTAMTFEFSYPNVHQLEVKACTDGKRPEGTRPSLHCVESGGWKVLYVSYP